MLGTTTPVIQQIHLPWVPCVETYGVEIECYAKGTRNRIANEISHYGFAAQNHESAAPDHPYDKWYVKRDMTISKEDGYHAAELVSPVLDDSTIDANIEVACEVLEHTEAKVNKSCGLHIHVGDQWLGLEEKKRISWQYLRNEETIDLLISMTRAGSRNMSCKGWQTSPDEPWKTQRNEKYRDDIASCEDMDVLRGIINPTGRYYKLNIAPFQKETIEFRHHHGTIECDEILKWKEFVVAFCMYSVRQPVEGTISGEGLTPLLEELSVHTNEPAGFVNYYTKKAEEYI